MLAARATVFIMASVIIALAAVGPATVSHWSWGPCPLYHRQSSWILHDSVLGLPASLHSSTFATATWCPTTLVQPWRLLRAAPPLCQTFCHILLSLWNIPVTCHHSTATVATASFLVSSAQAGVSRREQERAGVSRGIRKEQGRAGVSRGSRREQGRAEVSRGEQGRTGENKGEQGTAGVSRGEQGRAGVSKGKQGTAGDSRSEQGLAGESRGE